jgi:hypothetical protein
MVRAQVKYNPLFIATKQHAMEKLIPDHTKTVTLVLILILIAYSNCTLA